MTTATLEAASPETILDLPTLTTNDRCDHGGCNAAAYVRVLMPSGLDLTFCGHDYALHETALVAKGATIRDERHRLLVTYSDVEATEL